MNHMEKLLENMQTAMEVEYFCMSEDYGRTFHTHHEAIGVLLEEVDEVNLEADVFSYAMGKCWDLIKEDKNPAEHFETMKEAALHAAAEWIQIAACCHKAMKT